MVYPSGRLPPVIADAGGGVNRGWGRAATRGAVFQAWEIKGLAAGVRVDLTTTVGAGAQRECLIVLDQVVFAEVAAGLDRDQGHGQATGVLQPVRLAKRDVDGLAFAHQTRAEADSDRG